MYDVTNDSSFQCMDRLKKQIEKHREKRDVSIGQVCSQIAAFQKYRTVHSSTIFCAILVYVGLSQ